MVNTDAQGRQKGIKPCYYPMEGRAALASFTSKSRGYKLSALRITCSLGNTKALSQLQECCIKSSLTKALSIHIKPQGTSGAQNCSMPKGNGTEIATVPTPKLQQCSSALPGKAMCLLQFQPLNTQEILLWFGFPFSPPLKILRGPVMKKMLIVFCSKNT